MKYGNRSAWRQFSSSPVTLVILLVLFVLMAKVTWNIHSKAVYSADRLSQASAELSRLEQQQQNLSDQVAYLSTEQGVETELRTKFRAVKDGESVAVIIDRDESTSTASTTNDVGAQKGGWLHNLLHSLGL